MSTRRVGALKVLMNPAFNALFAKLSGSENSAQNADDALATTTLYPATLRLAQATPTRQKKQRYTIDLAEQMAQYEINYARLLKLLPNLQEQDHWSFAIDHGEHCSELCLRVVDRAPYTTTLEIQQVNPASQWAKAPQLTVCLYHDADMAEVTAWEDHRRLRPRYDYPNQRMYHRDEKSQLNRFLGDWLQIFERYGRSKTDWLASDLS